MKGDLSLGSGQRKNTVDGFFEVFTILQMAHLATQRKRCHCCVAAVRYLASGCEKFNPQ